MSDPSCNRLFTIKNTHIVDIYIQQNVKLRYFAVSSEIFT